METKLRVLSEKAVYESFWHERKLHILQAWQWGEVKSNENWQVERLGFYQDQKLIWILQLQIKQTTLPSLRFAYAPKIDFLKLDSKELTDLIKEFYQDKLDFIIWEFNYTESTVPSLPNSLRDYASHIQPQQTIQLRLARTEAELAAGLKGNYRRNIKKAQREGLKIEVLTNGEQAVGYFYIIMQDLYKNTKFLPRSKKYFENLLQKLCPDNLTKVFVAKAGAEVVGAYLVVYDVVGAYELYGGVSLKGRDLEAGYLLKWEAIKDANNSGKILYDHWGSARRDANGEYDKKDDLYQISLFKEGFGGEYVQFVPAKVLVLNANKYRVFALGKLVSSLRTKLAKLGK